MVSPFAGLKPAAAGRPPPGLMSRSFGFLMCAVRRVPWPRLFGAEMEAGGFGAVGLREHADEALLKGVNVVAHLASCAGVNDAAFCDDADLAAQSANFLRVMTAEKRGDAFGGGKPEQKFPHIPLGGQVQPSRGFVEEKYFGTAHEGAGNLDAALHSRAVGANQLAAKFGLEANVAEDALDFIGGMRHVADAREVREIFARRQGGLALAGFVADEADELADSERLFDDVVTPELCDACVGREQGRQHSDGRRLSGTVKA